MYIFNCISQNCLLQQNNRSGYAPVHHIGKLRMYIIDVTKCRATSRENRKAERTTEKQETRIDPLKKIKNEAKQLQNDRTTTEKLCRF